MRTANYSELRNKLKHYLDGVINDSEPLLVHRPGNESVVVMSLDLSLIHISEPTRPY